MEYMENPKSRFSSIAEMEASGLVETGWLPGYLPRSAFQIEERHNIDTNEVWASFRFKIGDVDSVESKCEKIAENDRGKKYLCPPLDTRTTTIILSNDGVGYYKSYDIGI
jgi:hypothetical protein